MCPLFKDFSGHESISVDFKGGRLMHIEKNTDQFIQVVPIFSNSVHVYILYIFSTTLSAGSQCCFIV